MVIVDTTVWIDYLGPNETPETVWLTANIGTVPIGLTDLNVCEILQGVRGDAAFSAVQKELADFYLFATGGEEIAIASARNFRFLRSRGHTVRKTIDCLIATFCILNGHSLLHQDKDFIPFEDLLGLRVIHAQLN